MKELQMRHQSTDTRNTQDTTTTPQRTHHKLLILLQAPRQIACLPAAVTLADCVLCVFVSQ